MDAPNGLQPSPFQDPGVYVLPRAISEARYRPHRGVSFAPLDTDLGILTSWADYRRVAPAVTLECLSV